MITSLRISTFCIILIGISSYAVGQQSSCIETLNSAQESFDAGRLYGIPSVLKPCLDNGFNKSQRIQAYWLLTRTYLFIDDPISAEDSYLKLLKLDPEFKVDEENDPIDMVYLSKKFKTTPIFVLFAKVGINTTTASSFQNFGVDNTNLSLESYSNKIGFQFGGGAEWNINESWSLGLGVDIVRRSYSYSNTLFTFDEQDLTERQLSFDIPVFVKFRKKFNKFMPYVYGGYTQHVMVSSSGEFTLIDKASGSSENLSEVPVTGPSEDLDDLREGLTGSLIAGIGSTYRIKYNYVFLDVRYQYGLNNIVDIDAQYANDKLLYTYGFVDDDKRLNSIVVNMGFVFPLYKPRKVEKRIAKGFFKKLF